VDLPTPPLELQKTMTFMIPAPKPVRMFCRPGSAVDNRLYIHLSQLLNPPLSDYRIDITRKNPSDRQKKKDTAPQANISHDFDTSIKRGKASGLLDSDEGCCYDTHIACVS
jgi:hypothetical protein